MNQVFISWESGIDEVGLRNCFPFVDKDCNPVWPGLSAPLASSEFPPEERPIRQLKPCPKDTL
jgi:hypothetical protein